MEDSRMASIVVPEVAVVFVRAARTIVKHFLFGLKAESLIGTDRIRCVKRVSTVGVDRRGILEPFFSFIKIG